MNALNNLDLNLLKALHALLEEGSVTRAAERLSLTQPAVSGMLGRLRQYFDDPLLVRSGQRMVPTQRAESLRKPLGRILGDIEALVRPTEFEPQGLDATLRVGMTDSAFRTLGIPFALQLQQRAPNVKVAFLNLQKAQMEDQLATGGLDVAVVSHVAAPERLRYRVLHAEHFVCAMRIGHPALQLPWDLDRFCSQRFALGSFYGGSFAGVVDDRLKRLGRQRDVAVSVQHFSLIPELLRQTDLVAVVPERLVRDQEGLVTKVLPFDVEGYSELLVWHERTYNDPVQQWLRELLVEAVS